MAGELVSLPLDDLVEDIIDRRGVTPTKLGSKFIASGHRVISAKLIKGGEIDLDADEPRFVDEATYRRWMRAPIQPDDVILTSEAPLGEVAYVRKSLDWCVGQRLFCVRTRKDRLHGRFLYYALQSEQVRHDLHSRATGTTAQGIRQSELRRVRIPTPPIGEQHAIAGILGALDDKIDLNRRLNQTLEATARALFKSWFVDFDPVHAKAQGRDPGLAEPIAELFTDRFQISEMGEIPEGWTLARLDDEFELTMGQSPPGETYNEVGAGVPFYQGRVDFGFRFPIRRVYCTAPTRLALRGDVLVSVRAPVGDINIALEDCAIGRGVAAVRHRAGARAYSYEVMHALAGVFERFNAEGTVFGSIGKKDFHAIRWLVPPREVIAAFEDHAAPLDSRVEVGEQESRALARLRDALLPRLISGEVRVPETLRILEGAPA